jgi:DNA-binding response OmpR family regulator
MSPLIKYEVVPINEVPEEISTLDDLDDAEKRPVVLIVDDEPLVADTLCAILSRAGYETIAAYDGTTALELAATFEPELLITDIAMPRMNGVELALAMVSLRPSCQILLFSGHATSTDLIRAYDAGHDFPLLSKPIHPTEMLRHVSHRPSQRVQKSLGRIAEIVSAPSLLDCA